MSLTSAPYRPRLSLATLALVCFGFVTTSIAEDREPEQPAGEPAAKIQVAILLDTSGSMEGLIHQARAQLWKIVNKLSRTKKGRCTPVLEVALYEYGKSSLPVDEGYLRQIVPLSGDLDLISEKLFELTTNGGAEYCGWVIKDAVENLRWSDRGDDLKMIFIAGNEPFSQGPIDFRPVCRQAIERGITINTIHCGSESEGIRGHWSEGAALGEGSFMNIDHNDVERVVITPYDKKLLELSIQLNATYLTYGEKQKRDRFSIRQQAQDRNAAETSPAAGVGRAVTKGSSFYDNSEFDLIDARRQRKLKLEEIPKDQLPENLRELSADELKAVVDRQESERLKLQREIQELSQARDAYLVKERQADAESNEPLLGDAIGEAIREQAAKKNFTQE